MCEIKHSPPPISQIRMLTKSGLLMHLYFLSPIYLEVRRYPLGLAWVVEVLLRLTDGSIPAPPFDLVMARAERCTFRDKSGVLVTPLQQQPSHYHIHLDCA